MIEQGQRGQGRWYREVQAPQQPQAPQAQPQAQDRGDRGRERSGRGAAQAQAPAAPQAPATTAQAPRERGRESGGEPGAQRALQRRKASDPHREGPDTLTTDERFRLLSSPRAMAALRAEVAAHRAHPGWWQSPPPAQAAGPARPEPEVEGVLAGSL